MSKSLFISLLCLLISGNSYAQNNVLQAEISGITKPLFLSENDNEALCIKIINPTNKEIQIKSITLELQTTANIDDVENIRIYSTGQSQQYRPDVQFGLTTKPAKETTFSGEQIVKPGNNYFWAAINLKKSINMLGEVKVTCKKIVSHKVKTEIQSAELPHTLRIGEIVRNRLDDGCHTYRIPGLLYTPKGTLISVYDARWNNAGDLQGDIDVAINRSLDKGQTWLPMQKAVDMGQWGGKPENENGIGDPAILVDNLTGRIWIASLWLHGKKGQTAWWGSRPGITPEETGQFILAYSDDEGTTWSQPINITPQIKKPEWYLCFNGPGMGITMKNGTLVFPAQFKDENQIPHSTIIYSKDRGETWHIGSGAKPKTTEAQVVELADGSLMLNMRDDRGGSRSVCVTNDLGVTWSEHSSSRSALQEPVCQASIIRIRLKDDREALAFFNPNSTKGRKDLTLKLSFDEGNTWPEKYHTLIYEPGTYGYSCLTQIDEETLGVLYEGAGELFYQQIDLNKVIKE